MTIDVTAARAVLLGVPVNNLENGSPYTPWAFGNFRTGAAYNWRNLTTRYLGQTAVLRPQSDSEQHYRLAFGGFGGGLYTKFNGAALVSTNQPYTSDVRLRYIDHPRGWIEHPAATLSSTLLRAGTANPAFTRADALTGAMSFGGWIRLSNTPGATEVNIVGFRDGVATRYPFHLSVLKTGTNPMLRLRAFWNAGANSATLDSNESAAIAANTWVHVGFTIESGTGNVTFYINGAAAGTPGTVGTTRDASNGTYFVVAYGGSGTYLNGRVSCFRFRAEKVTGGIDPYEVPQVTSATETLAFPFCGDYLGQESAGSPLVYSCAFADEDLDDGGGAGSASCDCAYMEAVGGTPTYTTTRVGGGGGYTITTLVATEDAFVQGEMAAGLHNLRRRDIYVLSPTEIDSALASFQIDFGYGADSAVATIGRLISGPALQLSRGVKWTGPLGVADPSAVTMTPAGQLFARQYTPYRTHEVQWDGMTTAEAMRVLEELSFVKGNVGDFYFIADPTTRDFARQRSFLARCASAQSFPYDGSTWQINAAMEEIR